MTCIVCGHYLLKDALGQLDCKKGDEKCSEKIEGNEQIIKK